MAYLGQSLTEGTRRVYTYTATASQTTFSAVYGVGAVDVYQNGVLLAPTDYTATNGTTVALTVGASANDEITIICHNTFSVSDTVSASQGGTFNSGINISSGNVGIGTTSPTDRLHIKSGGDAYRMLFLEAVAGSGDSGILFQGDGGNQFSIQQPGGSQGLFFYDRTNSAYRMYINNSGKVGIGTTTPTEKLHLYGSGEQFIKVETTTTGSAAFVGIRMQDGDGDLGSVGDFGSGRRAFMLDTGSGVDMMFFTNNQNNSSETPRMVISSSGNVGIGTTSPSTPLHVSKAGNAIFTVERSNKTSGSGYLGFNVEADSQATIAFDDGGGLSIGRSVDPSTQSGYTNDLVIKSNGYVGIGTFTPDSKLDIYEEPTVGWTRSVVRNAGRAAFTGVYKTTSPSTTNSAGIFAHNSNLTGWDDLWINAHANGSGGVAGGTNQNIYMAGKVHKPQQPFFHASFPSAINITSNNQLIAFSTAVSNIGGNYNTSNYRFTCPVAGRYFFSVGIRYNYPPSTSSYTRFTLRKNGSATASPMNILDPINTFSASSYQSASQVVILDCAANDYFDVIEYSNTTGGQLAGTECHFIGYFLG